MKRALQDYSVQYVKGIGPQRARLLARLGIKTLLDALLYLPYRYEDRRLNRRISELSYDSFQSVSGKVVSTELVNTPRGKMKIFELVLSDGTGVVTAKWFNQPYMKKVFKKGDRVYLTGMVKRNRYWGVGFEMHNPDYEIITDEDEGDNIHTNRIVPIYRCTAGLSTRNMRKMMSSIISFACSFVEEYMPEEILKKYGLPSLREAFLNVHFPGEDVSVDELNQSRSRYHRRLAFDELFMLQAGLAVMKKGVEKERGISFQCEGRLWKEVLERLPFKLTSSQQRVIEEIYEDMKRPYPMNRLVQGDVGSGKTIVALSAMLRAVECGYQVALMAPTEILAEQHYHNIKALLEGVQVEIELLTGSKKERRTEEIRVGEIDIVIGTHALIQETVEFKRLGLVVIDEQHRFGVLQRAILRKKGLNPDVLVMTATPIPRTLSLTLYGDLDYSVIDELPPNRRPVITRVFHYSQRDLLVKFLKGELSKGRQVYVVYPLIEESEKLQLKAAITGRDELADMLPEFRVGLIHGRMKQQEKEDIMAEFKSGKIDVLVSTTVIEVGVDVPNATVMVIFHAERFGLSQLHQLRGRVGRGGHQSYCILLAHGRLSEEARKRLYSIQKYSDGFRIAEEDFKLRGPGELFGTRQSGMPDLRVADLLRDGKVLAAARKEAFAMVEKEPDLSSYPALKREIERFWKGKIEIFKTG
ncbi:MAG: ATP-dependent DNA helicase RecG [Nitrospirae bacterium]|nr:MAG: ATP-dependent DNA helicase RecG [Nitrospirota bacterium]